MGNDYFGCKLEQVKPDVSEQVAKVMELVKEFGFVMGFWGGDTTKCEKEYMVINTYLNNLLGGVK